jgi:hypothetical protein
MTDVKAVKNFIWREGEMVRTQCGQQTTWNFTLIVVFVRSNMPELSTERFKINAETKKYYKDELYNSIWKR